MVIVKLQTMRLQQFFLKYKKQIVITIAIVLLQLIWGFDPKFSIINIVWLFF